MADETTKTFHLFHAIGENGADSAVVRKFIVDRDLGRFVEFHNVAYEVSQKKLREMTKQHSVPCLVEVQGHRVFVGVAAVLGRLEKL